MKIRAFRYYLFSFVSLITRINNWYAIPLLLFLHPLRFNLKNNGTYIVDNFMDLWTLKEVLLDDCYDVHNLNKCEMIVDIGSAIGDFSIFASGKAKNVISCEYDLNRLSLLKWNIIHAKKTNIQIIPEKIDTLDLILSGKNTTCDLLKIDCEGSEYPILLNSSVPTLKKIKKIVGELYFFNDDMKTNFIHVKKKLISAGFTLKTWDNPVHKTICYFSAAR